MISVTLIHIASLVFQRTHGVFLSPSTVNFSGLLVHNAMNVFVNVFVNISSVFFSHSLFDGRIACLFLSCFVRIILPSGDLVGMEEHEGLLPIFFFQERFLLWLGS